MSIEAEDEEEYYDEEDEGTPANWSLKNEIIE